LQFFQDKSFRTGCVRNCSTTQRDRSATYRRYGIQHPKGNSGRNQICELDHLVPLELGGADTVENIWPECGPSGGTLRNRYFKQKDLVENYLTQRVKDGIMRARFVMASVVARSHLPPAPKISSLSPFGDRNSDRSTRSWPRHLGLSQSQSILNDSTVALQRSQR